MSYDSVRQDEQMRVLDDSIDAFIDNHKLITAVLEILGVAPPRRTVFLFPGGMASKLIRATTPWNATGPPSQIFNYKPTWGTEVELLGGAARDLKMRKMTTGEYRDKGRRIIIADGVTTILGARPYVFFAAWCFFKQIDCFIFPWDWRRSVDEVSRFFVDRFLPRFQERLQTECYVDPLADYSLIGHSAGGMVVNWILRNIDPLPGTLRKVITVAAPFYGYGGQLHRWFEGEPYANVGGIFTSEIIKALSSFPGCYAWHFLPKGFYDANQAAFQSDLPYPMASYPSVDFTTPTTAADPYDPQPPDERYPTKTQTGFDKGELASAADLFTELTSPLSPAQTAKFVNIRGDTTANNTRNTTKWKLVPPIAPSPITTTTLAPGDGVQPAWTTRDIDLFQQAPGNVITVKGADTAHMFIMDTPKTWAHVAAALGIP
jgi:hypothetical protein